MDRLNDLLTAHFQVEQAPNELTSGIFDLTRAAALEARRLLNRLQIPATDQGISLIRAERVTPPASSKARRLAERARTELTEHLEGRRTFFTVPVDLSSLPEFQKAVLRAARSIPFGEVRPYSWVAERIGAPRAVRAVATAIGRNPVPFIVPCHRVVRSDGGMGGYLFGIEIKELLLGLERATPVLGGCTTTRIVCRVGCSHGRHMRPDNRVVFASVADARSVGYRPCKVCRPVE
jgi:O-6-methylguanine DNA methyltransferase